MLKRDLRSVVSRLEIVEDKIKDGNGLFSFASDRLTLLESEFKDLHKFNNYQEDLREIKKELSELNHQRVQD